MSKPFCPLCKQAFRRGTKFCPNDGAELVTKTQDPASGKVIAGRFTILKKLGAGGMGVVYKAKQITTGKTVAVKVISQKMTQDPDTATRFQREMRIQAKLEHPNIVTALDFDKTEKGQFFLVMPFIEGKSLNDLSNEMGPMSVPVFLELAYQILDGVEYAHRKGIIHRDLKAENIIITDLESQLAARILDFGIAKAVDADPGASSLSGAHLTRDGVILGTPSYMSPEQCRGEISSLGPSSDLYSMGVIFYQMLIGELPFNSDSPIGMIQKHLNEKPPKLAAASPNIPKGLETIIGRLLKKKPEQRYASAIKVKEALEALNIKTGPAKAKATMQTLEILRKPREDDFDFEPEAKPASSLARRLVKFALILILAASGAGYYLWSKGMIKDVKREWVEPMLKSAPGAPPSQEDKGSSR